MNASCNPLEWLEAVLLVGAPLGFFAGMLFGRWVMIKVYGPFPK